MKNNYPKSLACKPTNSAKILGQVFTPSDIADFMTKLLLENSNKTTDYKILDPAVGPFTFPKAILESGIISKSSCITTVDLDESMAVQTADWFMSKGQSHNVINADYLDLHMDNEFDLIIFNPPYVRQEWLNNKQKYQSLFKDKYNINIPGTSNLYVYFVVKSIIDLKPNGTFVCIIYDSWQSTIFGKWLIDFINQTCAHIQVHALSEQPFRDCLINATIIKGIKKPNFGPINLQTAKQFNNKSNYKDFDGFSSIESIFKPRRGLRLKQADFFLTNTEMINNGATPFIKKIGKIKGFYIPDSHPEAALLVSNNTADPRVIDELEYRINQAKLLPEKNISILTWYNERPDSWYIHPEPPFAKIIFNYYLRNRPRHIFNPNRAYSDNFYGLNIPEDIPVFACLAVLNSTSVCNEIIALSRSQGNGLYKIQLFEYREVYIPDVSKMKTKEIQLLQDLGKSLVEKPAQSTETINEIDDLIWKIYGYAELNPNLFKQPFE